MATAAGLMGVGVSAEVADRTGVTVVSVTCAGTSNTGATTIGGRPGNYVANLTTGASTYCGILSTAFEPGDFVEVYNGSATTARVYPEASGSIDGGTATTGYISVAQNTGIVIRKTAASTWKTVTGDELGYFKGISAGAVTASKAVVVDSNKDIGDFRNLDCVNLDAGASGTAGTVDVFPTTASRGKLAISCTDQTGNTTVSLVAGAMAAARTITVPDPGAAASVLLTTGTATATSATTAEISTLAGVTAGTVTASKAVVVDANKDVASFRNVTVTGNLTRVGRQIVIPVCGNAKVGATAGWVITGGTDICHATLPASQTSSTLVIPISGLEVGDTLTAVGVVGQVESAGNNVTLVMSVRKLTAAAADNTDAEIGTDNVGTLTADTALSAANLGVASLTEVVAADESLYVLLTGTTGASTDIDVMSIVATVSRQ